MPMPSSSRTLVALVLSILLLISLHVLMQEGSMRQKVSQTARIFVNKLDSVTGNTNIARNGSTSWLRTSQIAEDSSITKVSKTIKTNNNAIENKKGYDTMWQIKQGYDERNLSIYYFDRPGTLLPLLRVSKQERNKAFRATAVREWLKTQRLIIAATVRDAIRGMSKNIKGISKLSKFFRKTELVFVENNSKDGTRKFLIKAAAEVGLPIKVLGCADQPMDKDCNLNIKYKTGKTHHTRWSNHRTLQERIDRGIIMGALRNVYLHEIYTNHAPYNDTLLLIIDPDSTWGEWDLEGITAGLYYFMVKPQLKQLCAHSRLVPVPTYYDPCTLVFYTNTIFAEGTKYDNIDYDKSIYKGPKDLPPVKVISCFQGFSFYRLSALADRKIRYIRSHGEWLCEHNTISRQLDEVYLDPQMGMRVLAVN